LTSNKKERTAKIDEKEIFSFLSQQSNTHKKNHHRETLIRPFAEEEHKLDFVCCLRLFFSAAPRL